MEVDPQENDPVLGPIIEEALREAKESLVGHRLSGQMGFGHIVCGTAKRILKEKHRIDWKTPSEMNPDCFFD